MKLCWLVWRFLHDRRRSLLGLHCNGAFDTGGLPSRPHQQDSLSSPTTSVGPCHSLEFPLDALKCQLFKMWHQCCEGRLQIRAGSPTALEGGWVFFEPGTNKYWSSRLICFAGNRVWCIKVRLLPGPALILNSWGTNSSLTRAIFTMPLRAVNIPMSSTV